MASRISTAVLLRWLKSGDAPPGVSATQLAREIVRLRNLIQSLDLSELDGEVRSWGEAPARLHR